MQGPNRNLPSQFYREDFLGLATNCKNPRERIRYLAMVAVQKGEKSYAKIAQSMDLDPRVVIEWTRRYRKNGLQGLKTQTGQGRHGKLSKKQWTQFIQAIKQLERQQKRPPTVLELQRYLYNYYKILCSRTSIYAWLRKKKLPWYSRTSS